MMGITWTMLLVAAVLAAVAWLVTRWLDSKYPGRKSRGGGRHGPDYVARTPFPGAGAPGDGRAQAL